MSRTFRNIGKAKSPSEPSTAAGFAGTARRNAILSACDKLEAEEEIKRQHGPVKILVKDGKPVDQS